MAQAIVPAAKMQRSRGDRNVMFSSDDAVMMMELQATHVPDGRTVDVKPLLRIIEDILLCAAPTSLGIFKETQAQVDALDKEALETDFEFQLAHTISDISCEVLCKCLAGGDAHTTTVALFNKLSSYSWFGKAVIALAAFAMNYGKFWLLVQLYPTNPLAQSIAVLKQLPEFLERAHTLKPKFEALGNLIMVMLDVGKCIVEFKELPTRYINVDSPERLTFTAHIPTAVYWIIRGTVICVSQIMGLLGIGDEIMASTTEFWELSSLAHRISNIHSHLIEQLRLCRRHIDEKRSEEKYKTLELLLNDKSKGRPSDSKKILKALICEDEDQLPLIRCQTEERVSIDELAQSKVLLLISGVELGENEILNIKKWSAKSPGDDILWLPIMDDLNDEKRERFEKKRRSMPWYSVNEPLDQGAINYIKDNWRFDDIPLIVLLETDGKVRDPKDLHMIFWIGGYMDFTFTSLQDAEDIWEEVNWELELLADKISTQIIDWRGDIDRKYICLYGGEDIEWVKKFTTTARSVAEAAKIPLGILYVGKSDPDQDKVNEIITIINNNKEKEYGETLKDLSTIHLFWYRLQSMWYSKVKHGKRVKDDVVMREIVTMLSFDGDDQGWALFSNEPMVDGNREMAKAKGGIILESLNQYHHWKDPHQDFVAALKNHVRRNAPAHHCNRMILPKTIGNITDVVDCTECDRSMEKIFSFRCMHR